MGRFRVFSQFNSEALNLKRFRKRFDKDALARLRVPGRYRVLLEVLAEEPCIKLKEVLENFEIFELSRKRLVNRHLIDLCCGHGLAGILFALYAPKVERVTLVDRKFSPKAQFMHQRLLETFPELKTRLSFQAGDLMDCAAPCGDSALLAIHACGSRTDRCLDLALNAKCPILVAPCCYTGTGREGPYALKKALGVPTATDIGRTYRLHEAGYHVEWESIPRVVTPMNRVMLAHPRGMSPAYQAPKT